MQAISRRCSAGSETLAQHADRATPEAGKRRGESGGAGMEACPYATGLEFAGGGLCGFEEVVEAAADRDYMCVIWFWC
jgi:hypothetical protein